MKLTCALLLLAAPLAAQKVSQNDTLRIPISKFQQQQLLDIQTQVNKLTEQQTLILRTIVAGIKDPSSIQGWSVSLTDSSVVLIPPPKKAAAADSSKVKVPGASR